MSSDSNVWARDRSEGAHVGVMRAVENADRPPEHVTGGDLMPRHAAGVSRSADARADDEIMRAGEDRRGERADRAGIVGAVAIHEDHDRVGRRGQGGLQARAAVAASRVDDQCARARGDRAGAVRAAAVGDHDGRDGIAGDRVEKRADRFGFVERRDRKNKRLRHQRLQRRPQLAQALGGASERSASRKSL